MARPESIESDQRDREFALLYSDLNNLFIEHPDMLGISQPEDWSMPSELVLTGNSASAKLEIRERIKDGDREYMLSHRDENQHDLGVVSKSEGHMIWLGLPEMTLEDITEYRRIISAGIATWDLARAEASAATFSCFLTVDAYRRYYRPQHKDV